jgi:hypothetical protein
MIAHICFDAPPVERRCRVKLEMVEELGVARNAERTRITRYPSTGKFKRILRGVLDQEKNAVTTCQQIFNKYLTRNGRPIGGIVL